MNRQSVLAIVCGILPLTIVQYSYWLNIHAPEALAAVFQCNPYFEGCVSISRAVRSGPGLLWFKAVMLPCAVFMVMTWRSVGAWMTRLGFERPHMLVWTVRLGIGGAIALVFYVIFLGTEGEIYSWMRRYGVVFFFGLTALAQLLVVPFVWDKFDSVTRWLAALFIVIVSSEWVIGVLSVLKRLIFDDPALINRLENIAEWLMMVVMSVGFVLIGLLLLDRRKARPQPY
jgi:hypothetical protein